MSEKTFSLYDKECSYGEAQKFIEEYFEEIQRPTSRYTHALDLVGANNRVLDFGCGWGCFSKLLADLGNDVVAIDQDENSLNIAKEFNSHPRVEYLIKNLDNFEEHSFDVVSTLAVLEHVQNPGNCLVAINRLIKPSGRLIISVPNVLHLGFIRQQLAKNQSEILSKESNRVLDNYVKEHDHIMAWEPVSFIRLLASVGFKYLQHRYIEGTILPWGQYKIGPWPWCRYWTTRLPRLENLSYTMLYEMEKSHYIEIASLD